MVVSRWSLADVARKHFPRTAIDRKGYNNRVNAPTPPKPVADSKHEHHRSIYAAEATGLLLMAVLLLILTIIRYWRYIPWSAR